MSDSPQEDIGRPVIWVSYCYELGIYHYHNEVDPDEDPRDTKFTREELLDAVTVMMQDQQAKNAQDLVMMCAWARMFPHKVVVFYMGDPAEGYQFKVYNPTPAPAEEQEENADMTAFMADWKSKHPTDESIPLVMAYPSAEKKRLAEEAAERASASASAAASGDQGDGT